MSADKRKVSTDALETLGTIITNGGRDAIHLAVEPVIAGEFIRVGQDIGIINGKAYAKAEKKLGIADPFLKNDIQPDEMFWLVVYPRKITSLRHVWEHPEFDKETTNDQSDLSEKKKSEQWIRDFAQNIPLDYHTLMEGADDYLKSGEYLSFGGLLEGGYVPDEFWDHYETVTGKTVPIDDRGSFFSCSC